MLDNTSTKLEKNEIDKDEFLAIEEILGNHLIYNHDNMIIDIILELRNNYNY